MKLSFEKIREITAGAVEIRQTPEGIAFARCTGAQVEAIRAAASWLVPMAEATTGIRLDFLTDADSVRIETGSDGKYDILVNDLLRGQFLSSPDCRAAFIPLRGGTNRVTFTLPSHGTPGSIRSVEIPDNASVEKPAYRRKMLFLGDSITQGWNAKYDSGSFAYLVSRYFDADSVIQGVGGAFFTPDTVTDIGFSPDTVIVAYGTNDWNWFPTLEKLRAEAGETLRRIRERYGEADIAVLTPLWREDIEQPKAMGTFSECVSVIREEAERLGLRVIDGLGLLPPVTDFMADAVHPNDAGFALCALNLIKEL